jgi:hypothetical protein
MKLLCHLLLPTYACERVLYVFCSTTRMSLCYCEG